MANAYLTSKRGGGLGGLVINGLTNLSVTYGEDIVVGDLLTIRRVNSNDNIEKVWNIEETINGNINGIAFDSSGDLLAIAHSLAPFVSFYRRSGNNFILDNSLSLNLDSSCNSISFSDDGKYLAVAFVSSPRIAVYLIENGQFVPGPVLASVTFGANIVQFSKNSDCLFLVTSSSIGYLYRIINGDFIRENFNSISDTNGISYSTNDEFLAFSTTSSPFLYIYEKQNNNYVKLPNPSVLPVGQARGVSFSPNAEYLAYSHISSPFITIYKRNGSTFSKLPNPSVLPPVAANKISFSFDGEILAVTHNAFPFVTFYKRNNDTFTKIQNPSILPNSNTNFLYFSKELPYVSIVQTNSPTVSVYKTGTTEDFAFLHTGISSFSNPNYFRTGIATDAGQIGNMNKNVSIIPLN